MGATGDLAAQRVGILVAHPHRRQVVGGEQLGEHFGVDLVGLYLGLGDRPGLDRIRDDDARHPRLDQLGDRVRVGGRLDRHLVGRRQALGEQPERLGRR